MLFSCDRVSFSPNCFLRAYSARGGDFAARLVLLWVAKGYVKSWRISGVRWLGDAVMLVDPGKWPVLVCQRSRVEWRDIVWCAVGRRRTESCGCASEARRVLRSWTSYRQLSQHLFSVGLGGALRGGKLRPTAKSGAIGTRRANVEHVAPLDVSKLSESGWMNLRLLPSRKAGIRCAGRGNRTREA